MDIPPQPFDRLDVVVLGLALSSSWGNGHATTYRALLRALAQRGHRVTFLERDVPWYAAHRDLPQPSFCRLELYASLDELRDRFASLVARADIVIVGSYVPQGIEVSEWVMATAAGVTAFYDIDTPVTLAKLARADYEYLHPRLIPRFDLYLSFTGGPLLHRLQQEYSARTAVPLYCAVDPEWYRPQPQTPRYDLGYMGTYSFDRQPLLQQLLLSPAEGWTDGRFVVAGPQYPDDMDWPANVEHRHHVAPGEHSDFYASQRFTLNLTRADMAAVGYAPSVRLFEAAACAIPIVSDYWPGLEQFFVLGEELLIADSTASVLNYLRTLPEEQRFAIGERGRERVLREHTAAHRGAALEHYVQQALVQRL